MPKLHKTAAALFLLIATLALPNLTSALEIETRCSWCSGADLSNWAAAAWSQCADGIYSSCEIDLSPNQVYSFVNTLTIPALAAPGTINGGFPILDCHGSTISYTGTGDAVFIAPRFPRTISGVMRNCVVKTTNNSATPLHTQSIRQFHIENTSLIGTGSTSVCALEENTTVNGLREWTERNDFYLQTYGCGVGVQLQNNGGQPSFLYNDWTVACNPEGDQTCFLVTGAIGTPGSRLIVLANTYGTHNHQARVLSAMNGAQATFAELVVRGESDSSDGTIDCSTFADPTSIISGAIGTSLGANFIPCNSGVSSQVEITGNQNTGYTNLQGYPDNGTEFQPGYYNRGYTQKANAKADFLNGTGHPGDAQSMTFGLANPDAFTGPNAVFQVYSRKTTDAFPEVNVPGTSGNPVNNIFFADSYNARVGIGPGFGWDSTTSSWKEPLAQLHVRGEVDLTLLGVRLSQLLCNFTHPTTLLQGM